VLIVDLDNADTQTLHIVFATSDEAQSAAEALIVRRPFTTDAESAHPLQLMMVKPMVVKLVDVIALSTRPLAQAQVALLPQSSDCYVRPSIVAEARPPLQIALPPTVVYVVPGMPTPIPLMMPGVPTSMSVHVRACMYQQRCQWECWVSTTQCP